MSTQNETILQHLKRRPITAAEAIDKYGVYRLASRICELRNRGNDISSEWVDGINRQGEPVKFKLYRLQIKRGGQHA